MKSKAAKLAIVATLSLGLGISILSDPITYNGTGVIVAQASKKNKVLRYKKLAKKAVHVSKGNMYSSAKLNKVTHKAKNYKHTTFYRTKQAKIVKANKKTAVYNYIKSSNGKTKGWIWHGYVKNGKAPSARNAQGLKTGTSSKAAINKVVGHGSTNRPTEKKVPGTNIKLKSNKMYTDGNDIYMIAKNGHRVYFKPDYAGKTTHMQYATEVIPGLKNPDTKFTNNTGHWIMYSVSGDGVKETASHGDKDGWSDNGRIAAPIKGYKYFSDLYDSIAGNFPTLGLAHENNATNALLYNWKEKILINTPAVNKDNLSY